jgi:hypothetical protein
MPFRTVLIPSICMPLPINIVEEILPLPDTAESIRTMGKDHILWRSARGHFGSYTYVFALPDVLGNISLKRGV